MGGELEAHLFRLHRGASDPTAGDPPQQLPPAPPGAQEAAVEELVEVELGRRDEGQAPEGSLELMK